MRGQSRLLPLHASIAAAIPVADEDNPLRSIVRLHDDELSCTLAFLPLKDLTVLVRCSRRFNAVAVKERSRGLQLTGGANIAPLLSSTLSHHVVSIHLEHKSNRIAMIPRDTLRQLHGLPRLAALRLTLSDDAAVGHLMNGLLAETAAASLRAVLPTQLRSFSVTAGSRYSLLGMQTATLAATFWAALGDMTQLTELNVEQHGEHMHVRSELTHLSHLRKLTLGPVGHRGDHVAELKQLSQLRELTLLEYHPYRLHRLCEPPNSLQLGSLSIPSLRIDEETMRALLHLLTLTALEPGFVKAEAWPLLPQLPLLRRLRIRSPDPLSPELSASLCAALSRCSMLEDLTLQYMSFKSAHGVLLDAEQQGAAWATLFSSVPNLRRLDVLGNVIRFLSVLPLHLPLLEHLVLDGWGEKGVDYFASVAHPNVRLLEFGPNSLQQPSDEQLHACLHSERLPKLERCVRISRVA
jgi:hypothetical protein